MDEETQSSHQILDHKLDSYNSATIFASAQPNTEYSFTKLLSTTLTHFKANRVKGVWVFIPLSKTDYIKHLVAENFKFHHATDSEVALQTWLPPTPNKLPNYSTHYIGVGGILINPINETVLVIQESQGLDKNMWKIPGGLMDSGETLDECCVREVFEETGVESKFVGVMGFREKRKYLFNKGDIYFFCQLRPILDKMTIGKGDGEVAKCNWMLIEDFAKVKQHIKTQEKIRDGVVKIWEQIREFKAGIVEQGNSDLLGDIEFYYDGNGKACWDKESLMVTYDIKQWQRKGDQLKGLPPMLHKFNIVAKCHSSDDSSKPKS